MWWQAGVHDMTGDLPDRLGKESRDILYTAWAVAVHEVERSARRRYVPTLR